MEEHTWTSATRAARVASMVVLAIDVMVVALGCWVTTGVLPIFRNAWVDFDMELPLMTTWILSVPEVVFTAGLLAVAALLVLKEVLIEVLIRNSIVNLMINVTVAVGLLAFINVLVIVEILLPWLSLFQ